MIKVFFAKNRGKAPVFLFVGDLQKMGNEKRV